MALFTIQLDGHFEPKRNIEAKNREIKRKMAEAKAKNANATSSGGANGHGDKGDASDDDAFGSDFATSSLFPEEYELTGEGLTRLVCGEDSMHTHAKNHPSQLQNLASKSKLRVYESFPKGATHANALKAHRANRSKTADSYHVFHPFRSTEDNHDHQHYDSVYFDEHHMPDVYLHPFGSSNLYPSNQNGGQQQQGQEHKEEEGGGGLNSLHPFYRILEPIFGEAEEMGGLATGTKLKYALILEMEWIEDEEDDVGDDDDDDNKPPTNQHVRTLFSGMTLAELPSCSLHFLPESLQRFQPTGVYQEAKYRGLKHVLRGSINFKASPSYESVSMDAIDVETVFAVARKILPPSSETLREYMQSQPTVILEKLEAEVQKLKQQEREEDEERRAAASSSNKPEQHKAAEGESFFTREDGSSIVPSDRPPALTTFIATEAHMMNFGELAKKITMSILKPVTSTVGGALVGSMAGGIQPSMFQSMEGSLANEIPNQLSRAVIAPSTYLVVKDVSDKMNEEFPPLLSESIVGATTDPITSDVTALVTARVLTRVTRSNAFKIGKPLMEAMIPEILLPLGHILSKALSIGLTPVILHTLEATPHLDYYCWFCANNGVYCDYCTYAPTQLYYANYYAGYYSTYYAPYYTRYAVSAYQYDRTPLGWSHRPQYLAMPDEDILQIVLPADETINIYQDAEQRPGTGTFSPKLRAQGSS